MKDERLRRAYDQHGESAFQGSSHGGGPTANFHSTARSIFESFFGRGGLGGSGIPGTEPSSPSFFRFEHQIFAPSTPSRFKVPISLSESYRGDTKHVTVRLRRRVEPDDPNVNDLSWERVSVDLPIPRGVRSGQRVRLRGMGHDYRSTNSGHTLRGDLIFIFELHRRDGMYTCAQNGDLHVTVDLSLREALSQTHRIELPSLLAISSEKDLLPTCTGLHGVAPTLHIPVNTNLVCCSSSYRSFTYLYTYYLKVSWNHTEWEHNSSGRRRHASSRLSRPIS